MPDYKPIVYVRGGYVAHTCEDVQALQECSACEINRLRQRVTELQEELNRRNRNEGKDLSFR